MNQQNPLPLLAAGLMMIAPLAASPAEPPPRFISVSGQGEVSVNPDRATVNLAVESRGPVLADARNEVNATTNRFLQFCNNLGIAENRISTTGANIRPEYKWNNQTGERRLTGYYVARSLVVDLRDLEKLGRLVESAVDLGVNQVSDPALGLVDRSAALRQALERATQDARGNAQVIAKTLGVQLGEVRSVTATDTGFVPPGPRPAMMRAEAAVVADAASSYSTGQVKFSTRVNAQFAIAD